MSRRIIEPLLLKADIRINGDRPWDIQVFNPRFYQSCLAWGSLGFGESYMEGWWECEKIDEMVYRLYLAEVDRSVISGSVFKNIFLAKLLNLQTKSRAFLNGGFHYNLGEDLYERMLDIRMIYSCGYWKKASNLEEAQQGKLDLVCRKIGLEKGMKILDIGCGWGGFARYAAEKYQVQVVGNTVSKNQFYRAQKICEGWPVKIYLQDYRDLKGSFDRIISIGMFEHVGYKNYSVFMQVANRCLKEDGIFLLHTIGSNLSRRSIDPWIQKYIFPNALLPSIRQIGRAIEKKFMMEDWHNFGPDYDKTLMAWFQNFDQHWKELSPRYGERFYRMWKFYLLSCAATFRSRQLQLWQILFSKRGVSIRHVR